MTVVAHYSATTAGQQHPCEPRPFFVTSLDSYGLQGPSPEQLPLPPPSAWAMVGITIVFRRSTAVASANRMRFTVVFSLYWKSEP